MSDEREYGCVIFDDPTDPTSGWACVADNSPKRISSPGELSTGVLWWTNITYEFFFRRSEEWRNPVLRHDKYLVVSHTDAMKEWGYDPASLEPGFIARICSIVFQRVMKTSWNLIRDVHPKMTHTEAFTGKTLREDLRVLLPELDYPKGEAALLMKSGQAWEEFTATNARQPKGGKWVMLRRPRVAYAMSILQTPVPKAPFDFIGRADLRDVAPGGVMDGRVGYVREQGRCMSEVNVLEMQPEIAPIYGFGNAIDQSKKTIRSWVAQPEFEILSKHAKVEVRSLWLAKELWALVPDLPEPVKDFLEDKFTEFSWSAGIIAESLWRSVLSAEDKGKAGPLREGEERAQTSWQGLWLRAADKAHMFTLSLRLAELGYTVLSYGFGWIRCCVVEEDIGQFMRDGLTLGMVPLLSEVPEGSDSWASSFKGDAPSAFYAHMVMKRKTNMLWGLDRVHFFPPEKRAEFVKSVRDKHG